VTSLKHYHHVLMMYFPNLCWQL